MAVSDTATVPIGLAPTADLLAATAGISATMVAIIGGFLVSRVVALSSERSGLQHSLRDAQDTLGRAREALAEHDRTVTAIGITEAAWDARELLIGTNGQVDGNTLAQSLDDATSYDVEMPSLVAGLDDVAGQVKRAYELLGEWDLDGRWPGDWRTAYRALTANGVDADRDLLEKVYDNVHSRREARLEAEAEAAREERERQIREAAEDDPRARAFSQLISSSAAAKRMHRMPQLSAMSSSDVRDALRRFPRPDGRDRLATTLTDAEADVRLLTAALARVAVPPDLTRGFVVLLLFAVVGIVYPLVLLTNGALYLGAGWRVSVLVLFLAGMGGVFWYLGWTLRHSTQEAAEADSETSPPAAA